MHPQSTVDRPMRDERGHFLSGHPSAGGGRKKGSPPAHNKGFRKGMLPWNKKDKIPLSCQVCGAEFFAFPCVADRRKFCSRKCSSIGRNKGGSGAPKGTRRSVATEFKPGLTPWNKGEGVSLICAQCGTSFRVPPCEARQRFCSRDCAAKGRKPGGYFPSGAAHPGWKNGISENPYPSVFNARLKRMIRERDNFTCQLYGISEDDWRARTGKVLSVNHIDFDKNNCDPLNLNALCNACNTRIGWDRERWIAHFQTVMVARFGN